jgi:hypothetical protein
MLHLSNILAQGYRDWTPGQWGLAVTLVLGALGTFLLATFGPWLLKISKEIREMRQQVSDSKTQAAVADTKATNAQEGVVNANNRIVTVAALSTPAPPAPAPPQPRAPVPVVPPTQIKP